MSYLAFHVRADAREIACGDFHAHLAAQERLGLKDDCWRQATWACESPKGLGVRVHPLDQITEAQFVARILADFPTRTNLLLHVLPKMPPNSAPAVVIDDARIPGDLGFPQGVTALHLRGCVVPAEMSIPDTVTTLNLDGVDVPRDLRIPSSVQCLYLRGATIDAGLRLPPSLRTLDLSEVQVPSALDIPSSVTTLLLNRTTLPQDFEIPDSVTNLQVWGTALGPRLRIPPACAVHGCEGAVCEEPPRHRRPYELSQPVQSAAVRG